MSRRPKKRLPLPANPVRSGVAIPGIPLKVPCQRVPQPGLTRENWRWGYKRIVGAFSMLIRSGKDLKRQQHEYSTSAEAFCGNSWRELTLGSPFNALQKESADVSNPPE